MTDDDATLAAISRKFAGNNAEPAPAAPVAPAPRKTFTLSLTIDHDFRRRIRLLAARDRLSIVGFFRAAVAAYEAQHGKLDI